MTKREELFHKMLDEVKDYDIILMDKDGTIIDWNKGAEKIKGFKREEIIGKNFRIFYTKEDQQKKLPEKLIDQAVSTGKANNENWRCRKDGSSSGEI